MTTLADPPRANAGEPPRSPRRPTTGPGWSSWRLASRLARREVRRRPGRTALVAALIALPVMAMTVAITIARTQSESPQTNFERSFGQADVVAFTSLDGIAPFRHLAPDGSVATEVLTAYAALSAPDGTSARAEFRVMPFGEPVLDGIVELTAGREPAAPNEVLLSRGLADRFDVDVGDVLELHRPSGSWQVVGIGRQAASFEQALFAVADFPPDRLRADRAGRRTLVEFAETPTADQLTQLALLENDGGVLISPQYDSLRPTIGDRDGGDVPGAALAWGWVAGALALAAASVIAASAFASSARRQLVTIGQLAANGATPRLVRRTLALQGAWTGLIGSVVAIVVGSVGVRFTRPLVERFVGRNIGPWETDIVALGVIALTGVAAATIAATFPARSAARIPVLTALAGRRPLGAVPRRLIPIGIGSFLAGTALLVLVTVASTGDASGENLNLYAACAVIGGLAVLAGMCCASPLAVDTAGRIGARLGGSWRIGSRSVARARTRSAGVVAAIAVTGTAATAVTTAVGSVALGDEDRTPVAPPDAAVVTSLRYERELDGAQHVEAVEIDADTRAALDGIIPGAAVSTRQVAVIEQPPQAQTGRPDLVVADEVTLDMLGLSAADRAAFEQAGVINVNEWVFFGGEGVQQRYMERITIDGETVPLDVVVPQDPLESRAGEWGLLITQQKVDELGLPLLDGGIVLRSPTDLTGEQRTALGRLRQSLWNRGFDDVFIEPGDPPPPVVDPDVWVGQDIIYDSDPTTFPRALAEGIAVAVALLLTLLVVAIGLSLAAAESRDERDVMVAVGARPRTLRNLAAVKTLLLTVGAAVLAVPTGFIPTAAVLSAGSTEPIEFPWLTALGLLVAVPAVAALAALVASSTAQRFRPATASTLSAD